MKAVLALVVLLSSHSAFGAELLLENARILNPATQTEMVGFVRISAEKIVSVTAARPRDFRGVSVDYSGKFMVPGFVDMHAHTFGNMGPGKVSQILSPELISMLSLVAGQVAFLDLFNEENQIFQARERQRRGAFRGADIFAAGPILTCTRGHGTEYGVPTRVIDSAEDARRVVRELVSERAPDVVKIVYDHARPHFFPSIDRPTMEAAVATAASLGVKTVIHIGTWQDAKEAALAGASAITHLHETEIPDDVVRVLKERGVVMIPTMSIQADMLNIAENPTFLNSPLLGQVISAELMNAYKNRSADDYIANFWIEFQRGGRENFRRTLRKLAAAGVKVMTGSDAGNIGTFHGFSVHREMKMMVENGFSEWQAMASASVLPGEFFGRRYGISAGDIANLVVLVKSPLVNIENTQGIHAVYFQGRLVDRLALVKILHKKQARAGKAPRFVHGH